MSRVTRIYTPLDARRLERLAEAKLLSGAEIRAYAVTDAYRSAMPPSDDEETLEYTVLQEAAAFAAASGWRVIGAADLESAQVAAHGGDEPARVDVESDVTLRRFASLHVLDPAGERDPDADFELSWYDITELADVRRLLG